MTSISSQTRILNPGFDVSLFPSLSKISEPRRALAPDPNALSRVQSGQGPARAVAREVPDRGHALDR